ncbi:hypothetical protein [Chryseobacterium sp. MMS23-Vi53]|uniref:hypothetical protein n=1 Tax=Chryseobacterium sp. MMS23-Vi53 TaxID=3386644 RepID=UPI0039EB3739
MKYSTSILLLNFILSFFGKSYAQKNDYKVVPSNYSKLVMVSTKERDSIKKTLKNPFYIEKILPKGYTKNGTKNYTDVIQKALDANRNVIFPDFPLLISPKGLTVKSNSNLFFEKNSQLILQANSLREYEVLRIHDVSNVNVFFANIKGDRFSHTDQGGEWGMGISIRGTENILLYAPKVTECWGDGIYIGVAPATWSMKNNNITILKAFIDQSRRNGMSIITAQNSKFKNILTSNAYGTNPMAGIDVEPDQNTNIIKNLDFDNIVAYNNKNTGFIFSLGNLYGKDNNIGKLNLNNFTCVYSNYGIGFLIGQEKKFAQVATGSVNIFEPKFEYISQEYSTDDKLSNNYSITVNIKSKRNENLNKYRNFLKNSKNINFTQ